MNLSRFWCVRSASKIPLMPSPGSPKIVSTFQSISLSTRASATVLFIALPRANCSRDLATYGGGRGTGARPVVQDHHSIGNHALHAIPQNTYRLSFVAQLS